MSTTYEPADAAQRMKRGELTLVDVRGADEFSGGHVPGALHLPLDEIAARAGDIPAGRDVAFICATGKRSAMAAEQLTISGREAGNVAGGMDAWQAAGLPVQQGGRGS